MDSLSVEFDLRESSARNDPSAGHISVMARRSLPNSADHAFSLGTVTNGLPELADGATHTARILYGGNAIEVFVDDLVTPVLHVVLPPDDEGQQGSLENLLGLDDGQAWVGFTATTGDAPDGAENHDLLSWTFTAAATPSAVSISSPIEGASFLAGAAITIEAAVASTGSVKRVEFFQGTTKIGECTNSPYTFRWRNVLPGSYCLTAMATDEIGKKTVSAPVKVSVRPTTPPIGIHFSTGAEGVSYPIEMAERAGVVEQRLWNNLDSSTSGDGIAYNLRDAAGGVTSVDVGWDLAGVGDNPGVNPDLSGNHRLMKPFLVDEGGPNGGRTNCIIVLDQVPFPVYDVLVYSDGANGMADSVAEFRASSNFVFYLRDAAGATFSGVFAEGTGTADQGPATSAGNWVRFAGLTNSSFTLTVAARPITNGVLRATVSALQVVPSLSMAPPQVTRGPYLQMATPTSIVVRWRTSRPTDSRVRYGPGPAALTFADDDSRLTTEHVMQITELSPATRYHYAIGSTETNLVGGVDYYFTTAPTNAVSTRIWFISDYGFKNADERAVRDSYFNFVVDARPADVWLSGGDNDQTDGRDANCQVAVFGTEYGYGNLVRNQVLWPAMGNHDYQTAQGEAYYANFTLPTQGEAGGVPSGTEHYYSFNHGDVHFVSLDSIDGTQSATTNSPMLQWLQQDLASATQRWIIAYWHGAPYTKGSHDSDNDSDTLAWMTQMRQNALPILESHGVDLVLCGHSHVYERTWLINGHYGYSDSFRSSHKVDGGDGRIDGTGPYLKPSGLGTVYVTAAVGSQPRNTMDVTHPAHLLKITGTLGSLVIDVNRSQLDFQYINTLGVALDHFTISKAPLDEPPSAPAELAASLAGPSVVRLVWSNTPFNEMRFKIERSIDGVNFSQIATVGANLTEYLDISLPPASVWSYRVRAWNDVGDSEYSNVTTIAAPDPLRILSLQHSPASVTITWQSIPGQIYGVERSDSVDPAAWGAADVGVLATNSVTTRTIPVTPGSRVGFFRVRTSGQ